MTAGAADADPMAVTPLALVPSPASAMPRRARSRTLSLWAQSHEHRPVLKLARAARHVTNKNTEPMEVPFAVQEAWRYSWKLGRLYAAGSLLPAGPRLGEGSHADQARARCR